MITVCGRCGGTDERPHEFCANCNPWSQVKTCCHLALVGRADENAPRERKVYVSCGQDAEFEIRDVGDARRDVLTYACERHVGAMLGTVADRDDRGPWNVRALDPAEIGVLSKPVASEPEAA